MNDVQLHKLLTEADRDAGPPPDGPPLNVVAARKLLARRQQRKRVVLGSTAFALLAAGILWRAVGVSRPVSDQDVPAAQVAANQSSGNNAISQVSEADIAALAAEAEFHALVARRMIAALNQQKALEAWQKEQALGDPLENLRAELDETAFRMIARADQIIQQMGERDSAIAIYKDVIRLFPKTLSAGVAHDRLARLDQLQGET
jgi:hypothetical protein